MNRRTTLQTADVLGQIAATLQQVTAAQSHFGDRHGALEAQLCSKLALLGDDSGPLAAIAEAHQRYAEAVAGHCSHTVGVLDALSDRARDIATALRTLAAR